MTGIDKATMAHIHGAKAGENGDPIANLQISATTTGSLAQGNITPSDLTGSLAGNSISDLVSKMQSGETYVNVHTEANPNGEIRGQISSMANNVSEIPSVGDDTSSGAVKTFVNESGKFTNIPGETNELLSGESNQMKTIQWVDKDYLCVVLSRILYTALTSRLVDNEIEFPHCLELLKFVKKRI